MVPVRAGYVKDETLATSWWSIGAGLVSSSGLAVEVGYRQSIDATDARTISVAIKTFMLEQ